MASREEQANWKFVSIAHYKSMFILLYLVRDFEILKEETFNTCHVQECADLANTLGWLLQTDNRDNEMRQQGCKATID
jgi:phosphoserine aminotransferase